mmetsp:Transcript_74725/g.142252  ORF Transcript_74725/g.142252 Transcript_74725/m.142252 type:complete len:85 (-) Transcript_74725:288-542(-)
MQNEVNPNEHYPKRHQPRSEGFGINGMIHAAVVFMFCLIPRAKQDDAVNIYKVDNHHWHLIQALCGALQRGVENDRANTNGGKH